MGRLRRLELENFKSYAGLQIIGDFDDFTAIIGPNGAGKSNMMDAISFVLGIQSKPLRSTRLKDLIFRKDQIPERRAVVRLVYELSEEEIQEGNDELEIIFSRAISASGVSTYRLNEKEVSFQDYDKQLQQIGVLVKARNFLVFQGDVESIASKTPKELTSFFEQISGSDQYIDAYETSLTELKETEDRAHFVHQKKKMAEAERRELKSQREEAEDYLSKKKELEDMKTELLLWQILRITTDLELAQNILDENKEEQGGLLAEEEELNETLEKEKRAAGDIKRRMNENDRKTAEQDKALSTVGPRLSVAKERMKKLEKRLEGQLQKKSEMSEESSSQKEKIKELRDEVRQAQEEERRINDKLQSETAALDLTAEDLKEYSSLRESASCQTAKERAQCLLLEKEISGLQRRVEEIDSQLLCSHNEDANFKKIGQGYEDRLKSLESAVTDGEVELNNLLKTQADKNELIATCQKKNNDLTERYQEVCAQLQDAGDAKRATKQEEKMNDAIAEMKMRYPGVYGKLADLCYPIKKSFAVAVSTAGGKHMDAIVVDTKETAKRCIAYLKDHRIGTCSFLPLNNISPRDVPPYVRNLATKYKARVCLDLIACEDNFRPAVLYAVGSTLVCDDLDDARLLCFPEESRDPREKVKAVTLTGHVIGKSGTMTGGHISKEGGNRWEEKNLENLRKTKLQLEEELNTNKRNTPHRQEVIDIESQIRSVQTRLRLCIADQKVCVEKLDQFTRQIREREKLTSDLEAEKRTTLDALEVKRAELKELEDGIGIIESNLFQPFTARIAPELRVSNIREYEEKRLKTHKELIKQKNSVSEHRSALEARLEYELKRDIDSSIRNYEEVVQRTKNDIESLSNEIRQCQQDQQVANEKYDKLNAEREKLKQEKLQIDNDFQRYRKQWSDLKSTRDKVNKLIADQEIKQGNLRRDLHEILRKAEVDEISLPVNTHQENDLFNKDLEWRGSITQSENFESSDLSIRFSESQNLDALQGIIATVDLSVLKDAQKALKRRKVSQEDREKELAKKMDEISKDLDSMKPNLHAVEKHETARQKCQECESEYDEARDAAEKASKKFEEIQQNRKKLFEECFYSVSESLKVIYKDLTRSSKYPTGGTASLTLENTESQPFSGGINYNAMPPSKRLRDMDQLSGGEKTVAALALLFSIHSYRQAPFFVLDEVDAALDNTNVQKVCNYIRQRSKNFQCIVISLKDMFFEHADMLIGICKDIPSCSSRILTLSLKNYPVLAPVMAGPGRSSTSELEQDSLTEELNANIEDTETRAIDSSPAPSSRSSIIESDNEQSEGSTTSSPSSKKRERSQISRGRTTQKKSKKRGTISSKSLTEEIIFEEEEER